MKRNLYKKFQKEKKMIYKDNTTIKKEKTLKIILSFISDLIGKIIKIIFYILLVALCSIGATYLFNLIFRGVVL